MEKKILVDMSLTLIHHGHIRLLKKASEHGKVIVALTSDKEILKHKGYKPEISFEHRKEILMSIKYVSSVIEAPWLIDYDFFVKTGADYLVHGSDNSNEIPKKNLIIYERTDGISSSLIRKRVIETLIAKTFGELHV